VQAMPNQIGNRADLELMLVREALQFGRRAIVPSSFMISTIMAAGSKPASRARSHPASVCRPRSTPPLRMIGTRGQADADPQDVRQTHRGAHRMGPIGARFRW